MVTEIDVLHAEAHPRRAPVAQVDERRRHHRYRVSLPVIVAHTDVVERTVTSDVSIGGMSLAADFPLPMGTSVEILFEIPGDEAIHNLRATVWWVDSGHAVGVQFDSPRARVVFSLLRFFRTL